MEFTYHIGALFVDFHIPQAQSLKDKRMVIKSIKDQVHNKFNVSVAELDGQDKWQVCTLGFVSVGNDQRHLDSTLQNLLSYLDSFHAAQVCNHRIEFF